LPQILTASTRKYRSKSGLSRRLDYLYGTQLSVFTSKIGLESVIHFQIQFPSDRFLPNQESLSDEIIELLRQILFHPMIKNGIFTQRVIKDEIRLLKEAFEAEYNDKNDYAFQQFRKTMFQNELYALRSKGEYETLDSVTPTTLWNAYQNMLKNDSKQVSVIGDFDLVHLERSIFKAFEMGWNENEHHWVDNETKLYSEITRLREFNDVKQAKIFIGFRSDIRIDSHHYLTMTVLNTMLGDSDQAKLFRVIREERHLCYYVSSTYDSNKGVVFVSMGVEPSNEEMASNLAIETIEKIKKGDFTDEDIAFAKSFQSKRIRQRDDSILSLSAMDFYYRKIHGVTYDTEKLITAIEHINREDIINCANALKLDTIYFLTKKDLL